MLEQNLQAGAAAALHYRAAEIGRAENMRMKRAAQNSPERKFTPDEAAIKIQTRHRFRIAHRKVLKLRKKRDPWYLMRKKKKDGNLRLRMKRLRPLLRFMAYARTSERQSSLKQYDSDVIDVIGQYVPPEDVKDIAQVHRVKTLFHMLSTNENGNKLGRCLMSWCEANREMKHVLHAAVTTCDLDFYSDLATCLHARLVLKGETIFEQNTPLLGSYFVVCGRIALNVNVNESSISSEERNKEKSVHQPSKFGAYGSSLSGMDDSELLYDLTQKAPIVHPPPSTCSAFGLSFEDRDPEENSIGGVLRWFEPPLQSIEEHQLSHYVVYIADDENGRREERVIAPLPRVTAIANADKFPDPTRLHKVEQENHNVVHCAAEIPFGTKVFGMKYFIVYTANSAGEQLAPEHALLIDDWSPSPTGNKAVSCGGIFGINVAFEAAGAPSEANRKIRESPSVWAAHEFQNITTIHDENETFKDAEDREVLSECAAVATEDSLVLFLSAFELAKICSIHRVLSTMSLQKEKRRLRQIAAISKLLQHSFQKVMKNNYFLKDSIGEIPYKDCEEIARYMQRKSYKDGEIVYNRGDLALKLFIVISGSVELRRGKHVTKTLDAASCCGMHELFQGQMYNRTAVCTSQCAHLMTITRKEILNVLELSQIQKIVETDANLRTTMQEKHLSNFLESRLGKHLNPILSKSICTNLGKVVKLTTLHVGEFLFREGQLGNKYFVVLSGEILVSKTDQDTGKKTRIDLFDKGKEFGELALTDPKRKRTVDAEAYCNDERSSSFVYLLSLDARHYNEIIKEEQRKWIDERVSFLQSTNQFYGLSSHSLATLTPLFEVVEFERGRIIARPEDDLGGVYFIRRGSVVVVSKKLRRPKEKIELKDKDTERAEGSSSRKRKKERDEDDEDDDDGKEIASDEEKEKQKNGLLEFGKHMKLSYLDRGQSFGDASSFLGIKEKHFLVAVSNVECLVLKNEKFQQLGSRVMKRMKNLAMKKVLFRRKRYKNIQHITSTLTGLRNEKSEASMMELPLVKAVRERVARLECCFLESSDLKPPKNSREAVKRLAKKGKHMAAERRKKYQRARRKKKKETENVPLLERNEETKETQDQCINPPWEWKAPEVNFSEELNKKEDPSRRALEKANEVARELLRARSEKGWSARRRRNRNSFAKFVSNEIIKRPVTAPVETKAEIDEKNNFAAILERPMTSQPKRRNRRFSTKREYLPCLNNCIHLKGRHGKKVQLTFSTVKAAAAHAKAHWASEPLTSVEELQKLAEMRGFRGDRNFLEERRARGIQVTRPKSVRVSGRRPYVNSYV
eukprot:g843.t1